MSYILDALRKADAQRERDPSRGIHAQSVTALSSERDADPASPLALLAWGVSAAALLALAAWWLAQPDAPAEAPAVALPAASAPAASPLATAPPAALPPAVAVAPAPAVTPPVPASELLPPAPPMRPAPAPPATQLPPSAEPQRTPAPTQPAVAAGERLLTVGDLPPDVQRDLPKLTITGGVYSTNPAQRLLIVNGQVLNEGAEAAPGVLLTQIRPKLAVLTFRGWRYGVAY